MGHHARDQWRRTVTGAWYAGAWSRDGAKLPDLHPTLERMFGSTPARKPRIVADLRAYYSQFAAT